MFELKGNVARASSIPGAVKHWVELPGPMFSLIIAENINEFGCAIVDCTVRTVSPDFIRRSDLRVPYRTFNRLCVCMASDVDD